MKRSRWRRVLGWSVAVLVLVLVVGFGGGAWYFSGQIRDGLYVEPPSSTPDLRVVSTNAHTVTLRPVDEAPAALDTDKVYGLDWGSGYGQLTALRRDEGDRVTRSFRLLSGRPPRPGQSADLRKEAFPTDARAALAVPVRQVRVASGAGRFPAWYAPGRGRTWAVLVHGKGVTRTEMFRLMRSTTALGLPSLDLSYRHDAENGGGLPTFGATEWPDVEAGVQFALDHGARHVVLLGCSMGGAMTAAFLEHSPLAGHVRALVLDAPMLDYAATIEQGAEGRTVPGLGVAIPGALVWSARQLAWLRFGLDSEEMDYLDDTAWLSVPALVFHGTDDDTVPFSVTERLAKARPGLVTEVLVEGAGHVESWNIAPQRYDGRVRAFLRQRTR